MKKKKSGGGGANWMDTYGDMVTLLLCFFVLLYSMSTISEEKWKAIVTSFNPRASLEPTQIDGNAGPNADMEDQGGDPSAVPTPDPLVEQEEIDDMIQQLYQALQAYSQEEGMAGKLSVSQQGGKVYVTFNETTFFGGDSSVLRPAAKEVLDRVALALNEVEEAIEEIQIHGHTAQARADRTNPYPGDWSLSAQRAVNVAVYLMENSEIFPSRFAAAGFGQWRPANSNATEETKRFNRRVEMIISGRNIEEELAGGGLQSYVTQVEEDINQNNG